MIRSMLLAVGLLSHLSAAETLLVPEQYPTIQAAINNANYGDAIDVGPGSYDGFSLNASQGAPRSIAIRSREGASKTVIEGNSPNIFYSYYSGNGYSADLIEIEGFTIKGASGRALSNGSFSSIQTLIIKDITFLECQGGNDFVMSTPDGNNRTFSGIKFQDCSSDSMLLDIGQNGFSLVLENFEFVGCTGAITTRYGNWESLSVVDCSTNSYFFFSANINNASFESNVFGTSVFDSSVTIQSTSFTNNSSSDNFDLDSSILNLQSGQIVNCTFRGNAGSGAGCIYHSGSGDLFVTGCTFENNTAQFLSGGIYSDDGSGTIFVSSSFFCSNSPGSIAGDVTLGNGNTIDECDQLISCCFAGPCFEIDEETCLANGGQVLQEACDESSCSSEGACCISGTCTVTTVETCFSLGGSFAGNNTDCTTTDCPNSCEGDITGNGDVGLTDLIAVLSNWGPCPE